MAPWAFAIFNGGTLRAALIDCPLGLFGRCTRLNQQNAIILPISIHLQPPLRAVAETIAAANDTNDVANVSAGISANPSGGCL